MAPQSLDLGLSLGLGLAALQPSFCYSGNAATVVAAAAEREASPTAAEERERERRCSPAGSPLSSGSGSGKRAAAERSAGAGSGSGDEDDDGGARKKLRLSKDQAAVLEECFKTHHTLTPKQKVALASSLGLRPRQVEVWFQNRRARTKLKQTEVDCEYLKRWCEQLAEENRRLGKEPIECSFLVSTKTMMPSSLDLGLSLGLTSQGSLSSCTTAGSSGGAISPWAAAISSVVGDVMMRRDAHAQQQQQHGAAAAAAFDADHGAMRASTSPDSAAALSSGASGDNKRDHRELERSGSGGVRSDEEDGADGSGGRKKLRLSKDQAAVLEECFKTHSTLNPKQKVALANRLGLRPRQVEVWFQNRRARTKLKQTEVDCEYLKRWCERLADENKRLEKELADLRALKAAPSPAAQPASPAATLTMCPSCRRVATNHQQQCHPKSKAPAAAAAGNVVPSHCQFFPAAVDRKNQSTWNAAAAPLVTRELF
ncbi:Homeobox-leucine zipper protein HOX2 [Dichanthelium oligosanthes]|uniref:Homeobox-leucine zipper protein HOX2 n=1 Tax=Dichanthelium oligosanthes TaxID=888268 RepID=A0A1E5V6Z0_9POAL|nr:Homeobox-leucine zipper protein HOX2 [Dichanthelium oligosanthes]